MASLGSIMRGIGKGARAVGRGAMKGVLGFDDRDIIGKRKKKDAPQEEPDGDEINPEYTGYSKGPMMIPDVESDGLIEEDPVPVWRMDEAPPDIGIGAMEPPIGLEMPVLPGMGKKRGGRGGVPAVPKKSGGIKDMTSTDFKALTEGAAAAPKEFPPSAYDMPRKPLPPGFTPETAPSAGQEPQFDIDLMEARRRSGGDDPRAPKSMSPEAEYRAGQVMGLGAELVGGAALGKLLGAVPGLMRGKPSIPPPSTGYTTSVGQPIGAPPLPVPPAGPGKAAIQARLNAFKNTYKPKGPDDFLAPGGRRYAMPGTPGVQGPMPWVPGSQLTKDGRLIVRGPNNQMGWELLP